MKFNLPKAIKKNQTTLKKHSDSIKKAIKKNTKKMKENNILDLATDIDKLIDGLIDILKQIEEKNKNNSIKNKTSFSK